MSIATKKAGKTYEISISVSDEYLKDATTVYPVTIDPTIKVTDDITGAGNIEDAPVFSGLTSAKCGNYTYLSAGYVDGTYKIGRVVVRVPGLYDSDEYAYTSASNIQSVKFYCKDGSGNASSKVNLYPNISNALWEEDTISWATGCNFTTSENYGTTMSFGSWTCFDITNLAKAWKDGIYSARMGFTLTNSNESSTSYRKAIFSSEYGVTTDRPYVEMTYATDTDSDCNSISVCEGEKVNISYLANKNKGNTIWKTNNSFVATVDANGVVTAKKPGITTIIAETVSEDGIIESIFCNIYVYIEDGVYYIKNEDSSYYLHTYDGGVENFTNVCHKALYSNDMSDIYKIRQMWKIYHIGEGKYSIRPMNKLDMGLDVTGNNVDIYYIGTNDTLEDIESYAKWTIEYDELGCVLKNNGNSNLTMKIEGSNVAVSKGLKTKEYRWNLEKVASPPKGIYWYDTDNKIVLERDFEEDKYIIYNRNTNSKNIGLIPIYYSANDIEQTFVWNSSDETVATVKSSTGVITGKTSGNAQISAKKYINGKYEEIKFSLTVIGKEQYDAGVRIAKVDGKQYYDFSIPINKLFSDAVKLCEQHRCMTFTQYCEWKIENWKYATPTTEEWTGIQLASFIWFYGQVNHGAVWDVKLEENWKNVLQDVPYLKNDIGYIEFIFRNEKATVEDIGNIMYGYTGRATGFGEITLYWGGGVAAQGEINDEVTKAPLYGDDENDNIAIEKGFDMFNQDYPDYYDVGYDGIPLDGWIADIANIILDVKAK